MRATMTRLLLTILVGLSLAGCLQTAREELATAVTDDDALCQETQVRPARALMPRA